MLNDLKFALRVILKYPFSNAVIVFTIASLVAVIGLLFASFKASLGKNMPFEDSDRFVRFWRSSPKVDHRAHPADMLHAFQTQTTSFEKIGAMIEYERYTLTGVGEAQALNSVKCTAEVLEIIGMKPVVGRFFSKTDEEEGNREIVVLCESVYRDKFQSDPDILGKPIILNDKPFIVVGVVPEAMESSYLTWRANLWMPMNWPKTPDKRGDSVTIVARIKPNLTIKEAQAEIDVIGAQIERSRPTGEREEKRFGEASQWATRLAPLDEHLNEGRQNKEAVFASIFVFTLMGCVVLIACFNMTSLFLVQATSRAREMAVRLSVGASRWRIIRQMLLESVMLSIAGGVAGLLLSFWLIKLTAPAELELTFDPGLFGVAFGSAIVIGGLVSILPAFRAGKADLSIALKDGGQSSATRQRHRLRNFLVGSQVGMATILTVAAVLFGRSFLAVFTAEMNFDPGRMVTVTISPEPRQYKDGEAVSQYADRALRALEDMPGVEKAAVSSSTVTTGWSAWHQVTFRDKTLNQPDGARVSISYVSPGFCSMLGQNLRQGRPFSPGSEARNQALVNEGFVRAYFSNRDPIGEEILIDASKETWVAITGVVNDRNTRLVVHENYPEIFVSSELPFAMGHQITALVETRADAMKFGLAVRETLKRLDDRQPIGAFTTVAAIIEEQVKPRRILALVLLGMASFGVFMALMGVYGVVAYAVIERTREMGIRMALGADRPIIVKMIMSEGTRLLIRGVIPGVLIAYGVTRGLPVQMVQHVSPSDPWTYVIGLLAIVIAGAAATLVPARKMVKMNPTQALRCE